MVGFRARVLNLLSGLLGFVIFVSLSSGAYSQNLFTLSVNSDWPPFSYNEGDEVDGILPRLIAEIVGKRMGIETQSVGNPWGRAQKLVEIGELDALLTVPTDQRLEYADASKSVVYEFRMQAATRDGSSVHVALGDKASIDDIKRFRVCDIAGNGWAEGFYAKHGITYYVAPTVATCLKMISADRMDVIIQPQAVLLREMRDANLEGKIKILEPTYQTMNFTLLLSKNSTIGEEFLQRFDRVVEEIRSDGSYDAVMQSVVDGG